MRWKRRATGIAMGSSQAERPNSPALAERKNLALPVRFQPQAPHQTSALERV
ncbi:hypothetical protein D3C87_1956570 [compost metagenome]